MKPTGLLIFTLVSAAAVVGMFFAWPAYQDVLAARKEIQRLEQEYATRKAYYAKLNDANERLVQRAVELERLDAAIPQEPELPALYGLLQTIASESGLVVQSVQSSFIQQGELDIRARRIAVELKLLGEYASLKTFLSRVNAAPRFLSVQGVAFLSSGSAAVPFNFSVLLNAYSY